MTLKLYTSEVSPPARAVMMTAEELGLKLEYIEIKVIKKETMTPEYIKKNPQHTIPMLEDGDFLVWDSHAIAAYLVTVYGKDDSLYPKDPRKRALVDQRLHFNSSILFPKLRELIYSALRFNEMEVSKRQADGIVEAYSFLEAFLQDKKWLAGDHLTIADLSCSSTMCNLRNIIPLDPHKFPRVTAWFSQCSELPYFQKVCTKGVEFLKQGFKFIVKSE